MPNETETIAELTAKQQAHEKNAQEAQAEIETLLERRSLALVANYVADTKMVHLELIPKELLQARHEVIKALEDESLQGIGDKIESLNSSPITN